MKIFSIDGGANQHQFKITETDRLWVEENFRWLKEVFGYPNKMEQQVLVTAKFFPKTFGTENINIDDVLTDLCALFSIPRDTVAFEIHTDLRDYNSIPHQIKGESFECETELRPGAYKVFVSSKLVNDRERLIDNLIYEFIRIRLTESELEFDVGGDDTGLFIYLAGIYYGFGIVLAQNLLNAKRNSDKQWQIKWNYGSLMPRSVMAFSLATYANLTGEDHPAWKDEFDGDFKKLFEDAIAYLQANPNGLYDEMEVKSNDLFNQANDHFDNNDLESAIATLQKILFLTNDDVMKADVYNNMGYYYLRKKAYQQGISNFRKALALGPEYGYANDNLGYALIMTGELEEGVLYLEKAMETGNSDIAYTFRNFALYYQRIKALDLAEEFFQRAFDENTQVDLLEYHYGEFLLERGEIESAKSFFRKSAEKQEYEGIEKLRQLGVGE